ncbi:MAG: PAS domain S-box protein [Haloplanus sp.]
MPTDSPIRVLHVDDEPGFADMVSEFLEREAPRLHVETASSPASGLARLEDAHFDCVVSDYEMSEQNGLQFLHAVRDAYPDLPFILFTGKGSEELASDAISAGVTDYLQKAGGSGPYTLLAHRITNAVGRYHAQREIETSRERLSLFFEHSPLGAIEWNENFDVIRINETGEEVLGYDEDELLGRSWRRLVPESEHDAVSEVFSDLVTDSVTYETEHDTLTKRGERIVCEWYHRVVRDELGDIVTIFSKFQDVTERVERQRQLAQERAFTEQALDTLDDLFYVLDADGRLQRWNERVARETGYSDEQLAGLDILAFFPEDQHSTVTDAIAQTLDTGTVTVEADVLTADRGRVPYELTGVRLTDPEGDFLGIVGVGRDLSNRKERERELQFIRDLLSKTERIADVGGWEIDAETNEVFWSDHLFEMLGVEGDEEPPLEEALDVYVEEDRPLVEQAVSEALATGDSFDVDARFERSDGEIRWFRILGEPAMEQGEVVQLRGAVQDVTDHKRREQELNRQNDRLEEFASVVSHDLRNPLNVVEGRVELAKETRESDHLDQIETAIGRMEDIIEDMLWLAREGRDIGSTEPVEFRHAVDSAWNLVADSANRAELRYADDERRLPSIRADADRLCQLLENLLRNAIEHGGDDVLVTVGLLDGGFYVEDDGPGIPDEARETLFQAGYSTSEAGTGFGLSIVKRVAHAHGWDVGVTASSTGGARFEITGVEFC